MFSHNVSHRKVKDYGALKSLLKQRNETTSAHTTKENMCLLPRNICLVLRLEIGERLLWPSAWMTKLTYVLELQVCFSYFIMLNISYDFVFLKWIQQCTFDILTWGWPESIHFYQHDIVCFVLNVMWIYWPQWNFKLRFWFKEFFW